MAANENHEPLTFDLGEPELVAVQVPGKGVVDVDPYGANEAFRVAEKEHGVDSPGRWHAIRNWMVGAFGVESGQVTLGQAYRFFDFIQAAVGRFDAEHKKKLSSIACSPRATPEFPQVTPLGPTAESEPGLPTSTPCEPSLPSGMEFSTPTQSRDDTG